MPPWAAVGMSRHAILLHLSFPGFQHHSQNYVGMYSDSVLLCIPNYEKLVFKQPRFFMFTFLQMYITDNRFIANLDIFSYFPLYGF